MLAWEVRHRSEKDSDFGVALTVKFLVLPLAAAQKMSSNVRRQDVVHEGLVAVSNVGRSLPLLLHLRLPQEQDAGCFLQLRQ
jgi:hypothetical protein